MGDRVILHLDMDAFYASVEVRENPELAGLPLIVGHKGPRGVVTTCSYEARKFGVRSAMPSLRAMRLCPDAVWVPVRIALYASVSRRIRAIFDEFTPLVEPLSIDEAFLDLTGIARDLADGAHHARRLKERIQGQERLTASAGVAPTKFLAKLASDLEKPDGLVIFPVEDVPTRLWPMAVEKLWGAGPKSVERLKQTGIVSVRDLVDAGEERIARILGPSAAEHLSALARGEDPRDVVPDREAKSISEERTFAEDLRDPEAIEAEFLARSDGIARQLREEGFLARTVRIKVRTGSFKTFTRALTLKRPTDSAEIIYEAARGMFRDKVDLAGKGVRLLGVGGANLVHREDAERTGQEDPQPDLFAGFDPGVLSKQVQSERQSRAARASDDLVRRFGPRAITRARLLDRRKRGPGEGD